jgi:hypothetical protein
VFAEQPLHGGALHALAAAVNQPHLAKPCLVRGMQVVVHHRDHITRREGMKVDGIFDGDPNGLVFHC